MSSVLKKADKLNLSLTHNSAKKTLSLADFPIVAKDGLFWLYCDVTDQNAKWRKGDLH